MRSFAKTFSEGPRTQILGFQLPETIYQEGPHLYATIMEVGPQNHNKDGIWGLIPSLYIVNIWSLWAKSMEFPT